ncbi:hypothetical protein [Spongiactinospora sp. TRM90649]|uniref:hypothetical protein n=1 Tax=Spongiactinospora sp. TRM90649 TaxID=3031114 RepID=UPI0023F9B391|nr:hypothetical protein [Spongiactinospora sp. TRM90649]MDF5755302.1 hypothetical protein [Spongiactinospora sp. TRM90649]
MSRRKKTGLASLAVLVGAGTAVAIGLAVNTGDPAGTRPAVAADRGAAQANTRLEPAQNDPLSEQERQRAAEVAGDTTNLRAGRVELLYVQRDDDKDATGRRADAYIYDYRADQLTIKTIDLATSKVVETSTGTGLQPPPSDKEERRAAELLLADPKLSKGLREEFEKLAGRPLGSPDDLHLRGMAFAPRNVHDDAVAKSVAACAEHRCLRMFVRLPKGKWLDTSRIIMDLSADKIYTLEW